MRPVARLTELKGAHLTRQRCAWGALGSRPQVPELGAGTGGGDRGSRDRHRKMKTKPVKSDCADADRL